ncbi:Hypothetical protein PAU_01025 [Photorhabdus asymbiotica]|uniref:Uncharacterized protein n=1 Tax=Photorhabdus asymbiotica subsp. asymbiotica (strain ATCC 43949 / 3105-77) TaxID=553480 RepID=B6VK61_PHOAA|nr:Hypothetical protein PAU_01025 [Photorhabdus asymbiotica]CAR66541.1 Hypothetical protein PA-RVA1-4460 [Photorhabdus asymbiotica subsp. asymbiotica ATCC 43949]
MIIKKTELLIAIYFEQDKKHKINLFNRLKPYHFELYLF